MKRQCPNTLTPAQLESSDEFIYLFNPPAHFQNIVEYVEYSQRCSKVGGVYSQTRRGAHTHIVASDIKQTLANNAKLGNKELPFINVCILQDTYTFSIWKLFMNHWHLKGQSFPM